jgi:predicted DNA-binding protein (UPF0251 family)
MDRELLFLAQIGLGWFSVDDQGRIWRHARLIGGTVTTVKWLKYPERAERSMHAKGSYPRVMFTHQGTRYAVQAHRIVWMVVNGKVIPPSMEINHIDGIRTNTLPSNLELVTRSQNTIHAIHVIGRKPHSQLGNKNPSAKLSDEQVIEIRRLWDSRAMNQREIGEKFNIGQQTVHCIVARKNWTHLP